MKKLTGLVLMMLLCGCSHTYVITLTNGTKLVTASKPHLQNGRYVFKDAKGAPSYVAEGRVREIAPASMVKDEESQFRSSGR